MVAHLCCALDDAVYGILCSLRTPDTDRGERGTQTHTSIRKGSLPSPRGSWAAVKRNSRLLTRITQWRCPEGPTLIWLENMEALNAGIAGGRAGPRLYSSSNICGGVRARSQARVGHASRIHSWCGHGMVPLRPAGPLAKALCGSPWSPASSSEGGTRIGIAAIASIAGTIARIGWQEGGGACPSLCTVECRHA